MTWRAALYLCIVPLPPLVLAWRWGWNASRLGTDRSDEEEFRAGAIVAVLWPLFLAALAVFVVAFAVA